MYEAYSDYESMMNLAEEITTRCAMATLGKLKVDYQVMRELLLHYVNELELSGEASQQNHLIVCCSYHCFNT